MKTPPLLLGAALMFWGWLTGLWIIAAVLALVFEASRLVRVRWDLATKDFGRISDGCTTLFIVVLIYILMSQRSATFIVVVIQWLPVVLFPLLVAQTYSTTDRVDIRNLFLLRHRAQKDKKQKPRPINLTYPYFSVCIVSAGAANVRDPSFYMGAFLLTAVALWTVRSKRFSALAWICVLVIGGCSGFVGHIGLHGLQLVLEKKGLEWTSNFTTHDPDPFQTHTAIGDIGTLKPSGRIIFRVTPDTRRSAPALLRESTYNRYLSPLWVAMEPEFKPLKPQPDKTTWKVSDETVPGHTITVAASLHKGKGLLKLPDGAFQIGQLPVVSLEKSKYGTLKVEGGPGFVNYRVHFGDGGLDASQPTAADLDVPEKEKPALDTIRNQLQLEELPPREVLKRIESFFLNEFEYSLTQQAVARKKSALSHFLLQSRAGHCEYFATATVLLLRAAGIPARYCRGYAVQEFSQLENRFIVRDRHAHAWTQAYVDGLWTHFDTTPGSWLSVENAAAPRWQFLSDLWSWCKFKLSGAWWWLRQSPAFGYLWWLVLPVILIPARRLFRKNRIQRAQQRMESPLAETPEPTGTDSEFYKIEAALTKAGHGRRSAETLRCWIARLADEQSPPRLQDDLNSILNLHYRYRFDPLGISSSDKAALESGVQTWLQAYQKEKPSL
jgi:hypothetical protein